VEDIGLPINAGARIYRGGVSSVQRLLVVVGLAIAAVGLAWPFLARLGLGRLPGDILVRRGGFTFMRRSSPASS
jgi:hypothetical protein